MEKYYIGVDIGGTSIKQALITTTGVIVDKWETPTDKQRGGSLIPLHIATSIKQKLAEHHINKEQIIGIGAGAPGFVDVKNGVIYEAVNIGWENFHLKGLIEKELDISTYVLNDANLAALGENWLGAGQGHDHLIVVTLGTGVGGGIIVNDQVINGVNGTGGEIGHIIVTPNEGEHCNCGRLGCIETYASATGIARLGIQAIQEGKTTSLSQVYDTTGTLTSKDVFAEASKGDQVAQAIIDYIADLLGRMLANLSVAINPSKIVIGGGVSKAGEQLLQPIRLSFESYALNRIADACDIAIAQLGNDAGVIGAAYFVKQQQ
ncbi:ROK family glucokinase [Salinibacillus xinjiangensis]|uniref:Glucokinase n=1 Tax=Salinibacillus xinjiangensis TaxID=1229268 RepID=A0A6G1X6L6_9BACI|nr:ROK family glucokinase [Salinibacillus xinjiangensis]MRG86587.1 ROK family glucokinase [Salinibacillus xinjiangensis]